MNVSKAQLIHSVATMDSGDSIYIDSIGLTLSAIGKLRQLIRGGVLAPHRADVAKLYKDVDSVLSGEVILPQMTYTKIGGKRNGKSQ